MESVVSRIGCQSRYHKISMTTEDINGRFYVLCKSTSLKGWCLVSKPLLLFRGYWRKRLVIWTYLEVFIYSHTHTHTHTPSYSPKPWKSVSNSSSRVKKLFFFFFFFGLARFSLRSCPAQFSIYVTWMHLTPDSASRGVTWPNPVQLEHSISI